MIISSSKVGMSSQREYVHYEMLHSETINEKAGQAIKLEVSPEGKSLSEQLKEYQEQKKEAQEKKQQKQQENFQKMFDEGRIREKDTPQWANGPSSRYEQKLEMLRKMLQALSSFNKKGNNPWSTMSSIKQIQADYKKASSSFGMAQSSSGYGIAASASYSASSYRAAASSIDLTSVAPNQGGNVWTRTTVTSGFVTEAEFTAFQTTGMAKTADGREINFGVSVEMSRAFCAKYESFTQQNYIVTDPLVINLDSNVASVSDMKFLFDLDADGKEEEISFAGRGSGFLALDKNGDGKINDGSELFGTKSGDGFGDLAAYDEDGNGWIDEADSIFKDLKIWTKDENGKDVLMNLKDADVGAIYLGSAQTEFSLNNQATQETNGIIRKTGVYLKESGGVGTVQHVDLAV